MAFRLPSSLRQRAAVLLLAIAALAAVLPESLAASFEFARGEIALGQVWRLWTAHFVYFSSAHALVDLAALAAVVWLALVAPGPRTVWLGLLVGAPLVSLGLLWLAPEMTNYRGSSALSYLLGTAAGIALWRTRPDWRRAIALVAIIAGAKSLVDATVPNDSLSSLPDGVRVAWQAHLLGAVVAVGGAAWGRWLRPYRESGNPCTPR